MKRTILLSCFVSCCLFTICLPRICHAEETAATFSAELTGDALYQQSLELCNQEKYAQAIAPLEEAIKRKSNFADAYYQLGACYLKTKQFDKAKQNLSFAKILSSNKELTDKAVSLMATIPDEIEKEKQLQEAAELKKRNEEYTQKTKPAEVPEKNKIPEKNSGNIFNAVRNGDSAKVKALLAENPDLVNAKDNNGFTPLYWAVIINRKDVAEVLLANKSDVNFKDNQGETPLHRAAMNGRKDAVELLLANGADVNAKDNFGRTPLHWSAMFGQKDVADLLLANKADVNAKDKQGATPLHVVVTSNRSDEERINNRNVIAELLRQQGGVE